MNIKTLNTARLIFVISLLIFTAPSQAQLFGGRGLLGGGGRRPLLGGGRPLLGAGGFRGGRPLIGGGAPIMRPSLPTARPAFPAAARPMIDRRPGPIFGGGPSISSLPGPSRPALGHRPILDRPLAGNFPGGDRPILGNRPFPGNRPVAGNLPDIPNFKPPALSGNIRPARPVDRERLNAFLDNRPVAGRIPSPDVGDRPLPGGRPADRPIISDRPDDRPVLGGRPGDRPIVNRPIMPGLGEKILGEQIRQEIVGHRIERAVRVRDRIRHLYYRENHPFMYWWHQMWTRHPVWSWWRVTAPDRWASWSSVTSWCGYSGSYAEQINYEYTDEGTYANGQQVVVDDEYSKQARDLAAAGAELLQQKIDAQEAKSIEWLPLGVYALSDSEDGDPTMFLQLTISREGIVAGSFANTTNNENLSVQGGADRESARLAITIGDQIDVVIETGLYNVTEEQSSALVHYQNGTRENRLLVKMPEQQGDQAEP